VKAIYLAGPYRAPTAWAIEKNVRLAEEWGLQVAELGLLPVIPHTMFRYYHGQATDQFWLAATLELLSRCDAILMLPGWSSSEGSRGEYALAGQLRMPVFEDFGKLRAWAPEPLSPKPCLATGDKHGWNFRKDGSADCICGATRLPDPQP
jgi:hypothetical protein